MPTSPIKRALSWGTNRSVARSCEQAHSLGLSGHHVMAAQQFLAARERCREGSRLWAEATAQAFDMLRQPECVEVRRGAMQHSLSHH